MGAGAHYIGRFAPSPTGPLHAGSLVAALASWLDARAWNGGHGGHWLLRLEDLDRARCVEGAAAEIARQLQACALVPDAPPVWQSARLDLYERAMARLVRMGMAYPCGCSRKDIDIELDRLGYPRAHGGERVYPGTCRDGLHGKPALAWRFRTSAQPAAPGVAAVDQSPSDGARATRRVVNWNDRRLGPQQQDVAAVVGDFIVRRADGPFAYQLAVVVDDAAQGVTHVVRGADLADNTARQLLLQAALGLAPPQYLHTPLVMAANGAKLSKQNGARPLDCREPLQALNAAATVLGLPRHAGTLPDALASWVARWRDLYNPRL